MTTLHLQGANSQGSQKNGNERRSHRRHDLEMRGLRVERWDSQKRKGELMGELVDLSAAGVRVRTQQGNVQPDHQIRVRLQLPSYAGICPFVDTRAGKIEPRHDWVGWMTVARVQNLGDLTYEIGGRLVDMDEVDQGMLGLYLSTQPLAA